MFRAAWLSSPGSFLTAGETAMHRFESDAEVLALSTTQAAHLLQDYITPSGSWRMMTPGLASRTGLLPFNVMQTPAPSWAHNLAGLQPRRQILRAPSSAGLAVVCLHCHVMARIRLAPLAKQLYRMQQEQTQTSTCTFSATGNRFAFPDLAQPEFAFGPSLLLAVNRSCSGSQAMRGPVKRQIALETMD